MRLRLAPPAVLALVLAAGPALAADDLDDAARLHSAAQSLREAAAGLEGDAGATPASAAERLKAAAAQLEDAARLLEQTAEVRTDAAAGEADAATDDPAAGDGAAGQGGEITFLHALDNKPIEFDLRPEQQITPAVEEFHWTAENPYSGDEAAIAEGRKLYGKLCKACHLEDGTGRIGPNLVDDTWKYERAGTDKGNFEVIYAGGAGAMQAFGRRIDQDEILKVMAYLEVLGRE